MALYHMALLAEDLRDQGDVEDMNLVKGISGDPSAPPCVRKIAEGVCSFAQPERAAEVKLALPPPTYTHG